MSLLELGTKAQLAYYRLAAEDPPPTGGIAPPNPGPAPLPPKVTNVGNTFIGMMITFSGIAAVGCLVVAFLFFMFGGEERGSSGGKRFLHVLGGFAGVLGSGWLIGQFWAA